MQYLIYSKQLVLSYKCCQNKCSYAECHCVCVKCHNAHSLYAQRAQLLLVLPSRDKKSKEFLIRNLWWACLVPRLLAGLVIIVRISVKKPKFKLQRCFKNAMMRILFLNWFISGKRRIPFCNDCLKAYESQLTSFVSLFYLA